MASAVAIVMVADVHALPVVAGWLGGREARRHWRLRRRSQEQRQSEYLRVENVERGKGGCLERGRARRMRRVR